MQKNSKDHKENQAPNNGVHRESTTSGKDAAFLQLGPYQSAREEIEHAVRLLIPEGQVTELRALKVQEGRYTHKTVSGYFNDPIELAKAAAKLDGKAQGIYYMPNPVNPALLARATNRVRPPKGEPTTSDDYIERLTNLLIDADCTRPPGISASDEEKEAALKKAQEIRQALTAQGWPEPIAADSGNGGHLIYRVDLPPEDKVLIGQCLGALAARFSEPGRVVVDTTVSNPSRIWKLPGTLTTKGDCTEERPHRRAHLLSVPEDWQVVKRELLEALADTLPKQDPPERKKHVSTAPKSSNTDSFDLEQWIKDYELPVGAPRDWGAGGGKKWIFEACPWNEEHTDNSAYVAVRANGAIVAGCQHNGCKGKKWRDLRELYEPDAYKKDTRDKRPSGGQLTQEIWDIYHKEYFFDRTASVWMSYQDQHWQVFDPVQIEGLIQNYLLTQYGTDYDGGTLGSVARCLKSMNQPFLPRKWNADLSKVPFSNGVLNTQTGQIEPHSPDLLFTWKLPYEYTKDATCEPIQAWLNDTLGPAQTKLVRAYFAATMRGRTDLQRFLELIGPEGAGKGTLQRLATNLIGSKNTHSTDIQTLETSKYETQELVGKRLLLITDADVYARDMSKLRQITGGDTIRVERKHGGIGNYLPQCTVIIATNESLKAKYLGRRRIPIRFDKKIPLNKQRDLDSEFKPYLPGLAAWVLSLPVAEMEATLRNAERVTASMKMDIELENNPLAAWLHERTVFNLERSTQVGNGDTSGTLYYDYTRYCAETGARPFSMQRFSRAVTDLCRSWDLDGIEKKKERVAEIQGLILREGSNAGPSPVEIAFNQYQNMEPISKEEPVQTPAQPKVESSDSLPQVAVQRTDVTDLREEARQLVQACPPEITYEIKREFRTGGDIPMWIDKASMPDLERLIERILPKLRQRSFDEMETQQESEVKQLNQ